MFDLSFSRLALPTTTGAAANDDDLDPLEVVNRRPCRRLTRLPPFLMFRLHGRQHDDERKPQ
jgi:hypothetical protein